MTEFWIVHVKSSREGYRGSTRASVNRRVVPSSALIFFVYESVARLFR